MRLILLRKTQNCHVDWLRRASLRNKGALCVDLRTYEVARNGVSVQMRRESAKFLTLIVAAGGRMLTREEFGAVIWGDREDGGPFTKTLDVYLHDARFAAVSLGIKLTSYNVRGITASPAAFVPEAA